MGLKGTNEDQDRLAKGKVSKIKPEHVPKMIAKLTAMEADLTREIADITKPDKRKRLEGKITRIRRQINKATRLETQI